MPLPWVYPAEGEGTFHIGWKWWYSFLGWWLFGFSPPRRAYPALASLTRPFRSAKGAVVGGNDVLVALAAFDFSEGVDDFVGGGAVGDVYSDVGVCDSAVFVDDEHGWCGY